MPVITMLPPMISTLFGAAATAGSRDITFKHARRRADAAYAVATPTMLVRALSGLESVDREGYAASVDRSKIQRRCWSIRPE